MRWLQAEGFRWINNLSYTLPKTFLQVYSGIARIGFGYSPPQLPLKSVLFILFIYENFKKLSLVYT